jgi:hemolysin III
MTTSPSKLDMRETKRPIFREPVNGLTHLGAAVASLIGLIALLIWGWGNPIKEISLLIYGLSLILMFSASATYHMVYSSPGVSTWLRKIDHTAIYLLIAGTYTPICLNYLTGFWSYGLLIIIWIMALAGVIVKLFVIKAPRWVTAGIYLAMGWLSILFIRQILSSMPASAIAWLVMGGLLFTLGSVIYVIKKPDPWPDVFGFHEIWHIFVILGCLAHFILIAVFIAPA